jgi:hypothetical protein
MMSALRHKERTFTRGPRISRNPARKDAHSTRIDDTHPCLLGLQRRETADERFVCHRFDCSGLLLSQRTSFALHGALKPRRVRGSVFAKLRNVGDAVAVAVLLANSMKCPRSQSLIYASILF